MNFYIHTIKINSIASIGSLNIGNTVLSGNRSTILNQSTDDTKATDQEGGHGEEKSIQTEGSSTGPTTGSAADDDVFGGNPPAWRNEA